MKEFIDLQGVSGATYRFRLWPEGASHLPIAGNYVCVQASGDAYVVVTVGECMDLSLVRHQLPKRRQDAASYIYTRLNVARATRTAEHEDLAARYAKAKTRVNAG